MAEIRKHNPDDDGDALGKLVRDALGEKIRPTQQGHPEVAAQSDDEDSDTEPTSSTMMQINVDDPGLTYRPGTLGSVHDT